MIGLQHLHKQQIPEACTKWCEAAKTMIETVMEGNNRYSFKHPVTKKPHYYNTLQEKIDKVSKLLLGQYDLSETNREVAEILREDEMNHVFAAFEKLVGGDWDYVKQEAARCDLNRKKTWLYGIVYDAMEKPFEELYNKMRDSMRYATFKKLNVRTCPYCNRQYTFTLTPNKKGDPFTSPEFDHFFPKSIYPTLAVCFYNLVPSCHCCNHGKGQKQLHINPYISTFDGRFLVCDKDKHVLDKNHLLSVKRDDIHICYMGTNDEEEDVNTLGLNQLYTMHNDYVEELIDKANAYNRAVNQGLADSFQGIYHTAVEVHDFVWGRYLNDAEIEKRPLAKLTKDILEQLEIRR